MIDGIRHPGNIRKLAEIGRLDFTIAPMQIAGSSRSVGGPQSMPYTKDTTAFRSQVFCQVLAYEALAAGYPCYFHRLT
jgi:hypothetical protein